MPAATLETTQYSSYPVTGRNPAEIYRSILNRGPLVEGKRAIAATTSQAVQSAKRVIPVGTTAMRTLETVARDHGKVIATQGSTDIFIHPGFEFRVAGGLLTNFHLPKSTLIMLVSAFAGKELVMQAYEEAILKRYRFFSYGDCMLIV